MSEKRQGELEWKLHRDDVVERLHEDAGLTDYHVRLAHDVYALEMHPLEGDEGLVERVNIFPAGAQYDKVHVYIALSRQFVGSEELLRYLERNKVPDLDQFDIVGAVENTADMLHTYQQWKVQVEHKSGEFQAHLFFQYRKPEE